MLDCGLRPNPTYSFAKLYIAEKRRKPRPSKSQRGDDTVQRGPGRSEMAVRARRQLNRLGRLGKGAADRAESRVAKRRRRATRAAPASIDGAARPQGAAIEFIRHVEFSETWSAGWWLAWSLSGRRYRFLPRCQAAPQGAQMVQRFPHANVTRALHALNNSALTAAPFNENKTSVRFFWCGAERGGRAGRSMGRIVRRRSGRGTSSTEVGEWLSLPGAWASQPHASTGAYNA